MGPGRTESILGQYVTGVRAGWSVAGMGEKCKHHTLQKSDSVTPLPSKMLSESHQS